MSSLDDGVSLLGSGKHNLIPAANDQATRLSIVCRSPARNEDCSGPTGLGFGCELESFAGVRRVELDFNRTERGRVEFTRTATGTKAKVCESAPKDGHPGPLVRIDTGSRIMELRSPASGCRTFPISSRVKKFRVWWTGRSTEWVPGP